MLSPRIPIDWGEYCAANRLDPATSASDRKWRNAMCDVQALWSHINAHRQVFVTSDKNYHAVTKKQRLVALGAGQIETPADAVLLVDV